MEKTWLKQYPAGVPATLPVPPSALPRTSVALISPRARPGSRAFERAHAKRKVAAGRVYHSQPCGCMLQQKSR